jgi:hypothetical protein
MLMTINNLREGAMARKPRARSSVRVFNILATLGGAGHNWFERWAGLGVFLEPWLGRRVTNVLWAAAPPLLLRSAARGRSRGEDAALAFNAGISLASVVVHFIDWPWTRRLGLFPWLDEAEGLPPELVGPYNAVLWVWGVGGAGSILFETRRADLKYAVVGLVAGPLLLASARHHFTWAREQAAEDTSGRWSPVFSAGDSAAPSRGESSCTNQNAETR